MKIALVEDEQSMAEVIRLNLELEGYTVEHFTRGSEAFSHVKEIDEFDLVILDVMLPEVSGITICKEIRKISQVPILFLSAKGTTQDRIVGLKAGGNDYLPKPFDLEELLLKVRILTAGTEAGKQELERYSVNHRTINFLTFEVQNELSQESITLTKREIELLQLFIENKNRVISRDEILSELWDSNQYPTTRTIDNYILSFRKIFETNPKEPRFFHSIRSVGYKFTDGE